MRNIVKKIIRISLMISAFSFVIESKAEVESCATPPSCESLGYNYNASQCPETKRRLRCPFNANAYWCNVSGSNLSGSTCAEGGYVDACPSGQMGTQVVYYNTLSCYHSCASFTNLEVGAIVYSDKTVSKEYIRSKTPIGVVFDVNKKLAIALKGLDLAWGGHGLDVPTLRNCHQDNLSFCDLDGKENTAKIIAHGQANNISYPAAEYCYNYTTEGTKKGDWFLPSISELVTISENKDILNATLRLLRTGILYNDSYRASNRYSWVVSISDGRPYRVDEEGECFVLPVLAL